MRIKAVLSFVVISWLLAASGCSSAAGNPSAFETEALRKGDLTAQVVANGAVRPNRSRDLSWKINGVVEQVNAGLGDAVTQGQVLARLSADSLPQSVLSARADLYNARQNLDKLREGHPEKLATAYQELVDARKTLEDAKNKHARLLADKRSADPLEIENARLEYLRLNQSMEDVQQQLDAVGYYAEDPFVLDLQASAIKLKGQRDNALYRYQYLTGKPSKLEIEKARAALETAQAKFEQAQRTYDRLRDGLSSGEVNAAQASIDAAQATLKQTELLAPFDGILTLVKTHAGDSTETDALALRVEDRSHFFVDVSISEIDVNRVKIGQPVTVTFDAAYGREYRGVVTEVGISGVSNQGLVSYPVVIELEQPDEYIKSGMTAAVRVQVDAVRDVLMVPNRAVRMVDGDRVVYVLRGENPLPEQVKIKLGISSETLSQVLEGDLQPGDNVVLNPDALLPAMVE